LDRVVAKSNRGGDWITFAAIEDRVFLAAREYVSFQLQLRVLNSTLEEELKALVLQLKDHSQVMEHSWTSPQRSLY
jgi:hypothetical protein